VTVPGRKSPPIHRRPSRSGRLDQEEFDERVSRAMSAKTRADLSGR